MTKDILRKFIKENYKDLTIDKVWRMFRQVVVHKDVPEESTQYREMRKAYYSGFADCFGLVNEFANVLSEEQACVMLDQLNKECYDFFQKMLEEYGDPETLKARRAADEALSRVRKQRISPEDVH